MGRFSLTPRAYRRITLAACVFLGIIVLSGAAVRLTGSGLGCSTWPTCEPGSWVPREETTGHTVIEFGNRLFTFAVSASVILAVLGSRARTPRRADLTWWSWTLVAGVGAQIVLGGITVLTGLAPPVVMAHFLLSAVLLGCAAVLHHRAGLPDGDTLDGMAAPPAVRVAVTPRLRVLTVAIVASAGAVLFTGTMVTGSGPHGGDADVERLGFHLPHITQVHTTTVWLMVAATVAATVLAYREPTPPGLRTTLGLLIGLQIAQGMVGYGQYFTGVPVGLVAIHILGAVLVWVTAVSVLLRTTTSDRTEPDPGPDRPPQLQGVVDAPPSGP